MCSRPHQHHHQKKLCMKEAPTLNCSQKCCTGSQQYFDFVKKKTMYRPVQKMRSKFLLAKSFKVSSYILLQYTIYKT
jgi:hypothetical protein